MSGPNHAHLATIVRERRLALPGIPTQQEMSDRADVSGTTWGLIENAKPVGIRSLMKVMVALGYTAGSAQIVLAGGDPVLAEPRPEERFTGPRTAADAIHLSAHGVNLDELHEKDPEAYEAIMRQAEIALNRARERRPG